MRRRDREQHQHAARASARQDAGYLALELVVGRPHHPIDLMRLGLVLNQGEMAYRYLPTSVSQFNPTTAAWPTPTLVTALLTDQRLLLCLPTLATASLYWTSVVAITIDLTDDYLVIDYGDGEPRAFNGVVAAVLAVGAVGFTHGINGLLRHPGLSMLRRDNTP